MAPRVRRGGPGAAKAAPRHPVTVAAAATGSGRARLRARAAELRQGAAQVEDPPEGPAAGGARPKALPGREGWFMGLRETLAYLRDPDGFVAARAAEFGPVYKVRTRRSAARARED